jgi:arabinogalactan oligomer/maltooligosaccharide transport system substrate-binding protein
MKRMSMKRIAALLASAALVLTTMVGCTQSPPSESGTGANTAPISDAPEQTNSPTGGGTISVWAEPSCYAWVQEMAAKWEEETGNHVELTEMPMADGDYKHALDGPAGLGPDLMAGPHNDVGDKSTQGMYAPIKLSDEALSCIVPAAVDACTFEDNLYLVPLYMSTNLLIYNKDLVPTPPDTWDELLAVINDPKFDNNGDGSLGFLCNLGDFYNSAGFIWAGGGYMYGNNNTDPSEIGLNNEGAVEGATRVKELFGLMPKGMGDRTTANDLMLGLFTEGKVGMMVRGADVIPSLVEANINYGLARMPKLPNGNVIANYSGFTGMAMSGFAHEPELATEFLNFIVQDQFAASFAEKTGLIPCNQKYLDDNSSTNETIKAFNEQISYSVPMVKIIEGNQTWDPMHAAMGSLATGADPKEALDIAVKQIEDNIASLHAGQ